MSYSTKEIKYANKSKHKLTRQSHVILLVITDGKKIVLSCYKKLSALLRAIKSKHNGDFYCLI